jgi:clan AA aspartic protease (TIGR02281 family)
MRNRVLVFALLLSGGCSFLEATGEAVGVVGKVGWTAAKTAGSAVYTGTSMAGQTANQANKTISRPEGSSDKRETRASGVRRSVVPLIREQKSFFVRVKLNDKLWGKFLLDTGASALQISGKMARRLKVDLSQAQVVPVTLAGGAMVKGKIVTLKSVQIGGVELTNVQAIVLERDNMDLRDGLLGMSVLEHFVFQIDTQSGELILEERKPESNDRKNGDRQ